MLTKRIIELYQLTRESVERDFTDTPPQKIPPRKSEVCAVIINGRAYSPDLALVCLGLPRAAFTKNQAAEVFDRLGFPLIPWCELPKDPLWSYRPRYQKEEKEMEIKEVVTFRLGGEPYALTQELVEQRLAGVDPELVRLYAVRVNNRSYPLTQAFERATGIFRNRFPVTQALRVFHKLGFPIQRREGLELVEERRLSCSEEQAPSPEQDAPSPAPPAPPPAPRMLTEEEWEKAREYRKLHPPTSAVGALKRAEAAQREHAQRLAQEFAQRKNEGKPAEPKRQAPTPDVGDFEEYVPED